MWLQRQHEKSAWYTQENFGARQNEAAWHTRAHARVCRRHSDRSSPYQRRNLISAGAADLIELIDNPASQEWPSTTHAVKECVRGVGIGQ